MGKKEQARIAVCIVLAWLVSANIVLAPSQPTMLAPSIPEFTLKFEAHPYDVPPIYGIDQQTGEKVTVQSGYHVENKSIDIVIKNQLYMGSSNDSKSWLVYNVRAKEHSEVSWREISYHNPHIKNGPSAQPDSEYKTLWIYADNYALGSQIDFQVQAYVVTFNETKGISGYDIGAPSNWSNTQTITIPNVWPTSTPSPSPSIFPFSFNSADGDFSIIVLPDTQGYVKYYPWIFDNQTQWIVNNKDKLNIVFVSQLGDLVDQTENLTQWENANRSMSRLDGTVPWAVLPGNHDMNGFNLTNYDTFFNFGRFSGESWYGGAYEENNTNSFELFSAAGCDFLIFHLQYDPSEAVLTWAGKVIDQHPERRVIVATHDYMSGWTGLGERSEIGERIWQGLIKPHADQIFLVFCGHSGAEDLIVDNVDGHVVYQVLADFANAANFQSGWVRIFEFSPSQNKICLRTYSPLFKEYKSGPQSDFILEYNMTNAPNPDFSLWLILPFAVVTALIAVIVAKKIKTKSQGKEEIGYSP